MKNLLKNKKFLIVFGLMILAGIGFFVGKMIYWNNEARKMKAEIMDDWDNNRTDGLKYEWAKAIADTTEAGGRNAGLTFEQAVEKNLTYWFKMNKNVNVTF